MKREIGNKDFPIWLLGDSEPENWRQVLDAPFDSRHPVRHSIWTPILEIIQDSVFRKISNRIDTSSIYIRNAIGNPSEKPNPNSIDWNQSVKDETVTFKKLIDQNNPKIILCFGAFSYEFARRAFNEQPNRKYSYWTSIELGNEFRSRIEHFNFKATNTISLLHNVISGGKFLKAHKNFCGHEGGNYFNYAGTEIAEKILEYDDRLQIWINPIHE